MKPIYLFYEKSLTSGYGHFNRSYKLFTYLKKNGFPVYLFNIEDKKSHKLDVSSNIVILDVSFHPNNVATEICKRAQISIGLDWFHSTCVDYNIVIYPHTNPEAKIHVCSGFEYIIVDEKILNIATKPNVEALEKVLIIIGGADVKGDSIKTGNYLYDLGYKVHVVLGEMASIPDLLPNYRVSKNINSNGIANAIADADWMVTNGGTCLFEAAAACRPSIALAQTEAEARIINFFQEKKAIIGTQIEDFQNVNNIDNIIQNAKNLVDGRGLEKISMLINEILEA